MSDTLRNRIAEVKRMHDFDSDDISCPCGYRFDSKIDQHLHLADAVIAELGLQKQFLHDGIIETGHPKTWQYPCEIRYTTDWMTDE